MFISLDEARSYFCGSIPFSGRYEISVWALMVMIQRVFPAVKVQNLVERYLLVLKVI